MVKSILLNVDDAIFFKMKKDKSIREANMGHSITWEHYIKLLFQVNGNK